MEKTDLDVRTKEELQHALEEADNIIMKNYMSRLSSYNVKELSDDIRKKDINKTVRLNKIDKIIYNANENNLHKLMNVYNAVGLCGGNIINIIHSDGEEVEYYLGTSIDDFNFVSTCQETLLNTFKGNFPGSSAKLQKKNDLLNLMEKIFGNDMDKKRISVVSGIPGLKNEDDRQNNKYVQGIEKIIDAMRGKKYTLITISSPESAYKISKIRSAYEKLYSQLSPFENTMVSYSESDSEAVAKTITNSFTESYGSSIADTMTHAHGEHKGNSDSFSVNILPYGLGGLDWSDSEGYSNQSGMSKTLTTNNSQGNSNSEGKTDTHTRIDGRSLQINVKNRTVKNLLDKIDRMIKRIDDSVDLGLWDTATYCIASNAQESMVASSAVEALCRGNKSSIESFTVSIWEDQRREKHIFEYVKKFMHPQLIMDGNMQQYDINPASLINGKELVIEAGLPHKSVPGIAVSNMVPFSRNIVTNKTRKNDILELGNIYHMGSVETTKVDLEIKSLSSHTLITGSTGSGKSNTVYHILNNLEKQNISFLVVEPAKGEYKNIFGNRKNVNVYGTNEKYMELLRINPFQFPESIHVLEHVDRLIEIFNVCWPMYAAMPAVLKDAVLGAYEQCGWDLENSENVYGNSIYPTFKDVQKELICTINRSAYSEEVKGNYIGSLVTRIKSLTNGINGKIFSGHAIGYSKLFDENTIIDLSRVGSTETKSLIMGIVVMVLGEYRLDQSQNKMNQSLKHITVLEEAHNLLKNTSEFTNSEGGEGIAGKSVEMITSSIAEMRTYGEGFIIVEQSPGEIDISAIRNTNTKIIMRLPEKSDREQAGKSAALKDDQIEELAKLERGVAVVYQNNWLDPVLCLINKADVEETPYTYKNSDISTYKEDKTDILKMLMINRVDEKLDLDFEKLYGQLENVELSMKNKIILESVIRDLEKDGNSELLSEKAFSKLSEIVVELVGCEEHLNRFLEYGDNCELLQRRLNREIEHCTENLSNEFKIAISQSIVREIARQDADNLDLYSQWREYAINKRKLV